MPCTKGMTGCRLDCGHKAMVREYRLARHNAEMQRESETAGYATETRLHGPILTFRDWLIGLRGSRQEQAA